MMAWKRFFFDSLWPARNKWGDLSQQDQLQDAKDGQDFKINVCVRFRPLLEPPPDSKLSLPLHQFVKLKRQQMREKNKRQGKEVTPSHPCMHLFSPHPSLTH